MDKEKWGGNEREMSIHFGRSGDQIENWYPAYQSEKCSLSAHRMQYQGEESLFFLWNPRKA